MLKISKREKEVLEMCSRCADDKVAAEHLGMSSSQVGVHKSRVKRKEYLAKRFLRQTRKYKNVLHPEKKYKV